MKNLMLLVCFMFLVSFSSFASDAHAKDCKLGKNAAKKSQVDKKIVKQVDTKTAKKVDVQCWYGPNYIVCNYSGTWVVTIW